MGIISFIYRNEKGNEILLTGNKIKLSSQKGLSSLDNNINTTKGVNQNGSTYVNSNIEDREVDLKLRIISSVEEYRAIKRNIYDVFNPIYKGELILKNADGEKKLCTRVSHSPNFISDGNKRECEISLIALDPYWRDASETIIKIASWRDNFFFPLVIPEEGIMLGYREPSLIANAKNLGDIKTGMRIELKALQEVINPQIFNLETRDYIKINKTMTPGETIIITTDFSNKKVYSNNDGVIENAFNYLDLYSTFLQLEIGDNLLRYNSDSGLESLEVTISYSSRYVGV